MITTLERFLGRKQQIATDERYEAWAPYRALLDAFVAGDEVDLDSATEIIAAAGKTDEELRRDVEQLRERQTRYSQVQAGKDAMQRRQAVESELAKLDAQLSKLRQKLAPRIEELQGELAKCDSQMFACEYAKSYLGGSVMNPQLLATEAELISERKELSSRKREIEEKIRQCNTPFHEKLLEQWQVRKAAASSIDGIEHARCNAEIKQKKLNLAQAYARHEALAKELQPIEQRLRVINTELEKLEAEKLVP